jgi:outer membrane immunogenic protein
MRSVILAAGAAALVTTLATPALAQSADPFTGARAGVIVGWDRLQPGSDSDSSIRGDHHADGLAYGGDLGYDIGLGGVTIGAEGEVTGSTAKTTNSPINQAALGYGSVKAGRDLYIGGRLGLHAGATTLIYGKAGYTNQRLDLAASDGSSVAGDHFNLDGYRVGAGIEEAISRHAYAKVEYRYSNYGDARLEYGAGGNTNNFDVNTDRHQVVAGVGIRF